MASRSKSSKLSEILGRLEAAYGPLVATEDPVEAGLLALLAEHAPDLARVQTRQALREWVVDWNEMRVSDAWDIAHAIAPGGHDGARAFARSALRLLSSLEVVANRCAFDRALADPEFDIDAAVDRMRGVPAHARAVMKAVLAEGDEWKPDSAVLKAVQKLGLVTRTTSLAKVAKGLAAISEPGDRLRAHYLLTRYANRAADSADPLAAPAGKTSAKKRAAKKTAPKKTAAKNGAKKPLKKKTVTKKTASKKTAAARKPAKKPVRGTVKKTARKTTARAAKKSKR